MFDTQTKKSICLLLVLVMVLSLMPMNVLATDGTDDEVPEQTIDTVVYINGQDVTQIDEEDDTISWDAETKTLTLNNANILADNGTHKGSGIYVVGYDTVILELKGESTVEGKFNGRVEGSYQYVDDVFASAAISTVGNLIIRGEGTLNATDLAVEDAHTRSAGIYSGGELTIEGGTINATGGASNNSDSDPGSAGIISGDFSSWGSMRITGGTVNATGDTYGIVTFTTLMIFDGTVNAIAKGESRGSGIYTPGQNGGFEAGGVYFYGGTTTMSGSDGAVKGITYFQNFGVYKWTDTPNGVFQYSGLGPASGMSTQYLRIEPSEYDFVMPSSVNRYTADVQFNDGEACGALPENVTAEYKWYSYNEQFLTDADFDESTVLYVTYDAATGLWTTTPQSGGECIGVMGITAEVGDIVTVTISQKPSDLVLVLSAVTERFFEERSDGVFTHTVTEADLDPETGLLVLYLIAIAPFQYTLSLSDTEEVQTASDKPNQFISDTAGTYMCSATVYADGSSLGTFTSAPFAYTYTGWKEIKDEGGNVLGTQYILNHETQYTGWTEIEGEWYYLDPVTGYRVEGEARLPYPTEKINGVTYAPDQEAIDYAASKGQTFIDETTGLFLFDENGVFQSDYTGIITGNRWAVNGQIAWHVGLVQVGEDYYYFVGDSVNGGNKMATGDTYVNRNTTAFDMVVGALYTFGADGKLCKYEGIVEVNGVLRYYENARLMIGNGLTKVGENYIYVDSNGALIVNAEYYVAANELGIASGTYFFNENGYLIDPIYTAKTGVYFENGAWYYYENGKIGYNKGLIYVDTTWYAADGSENAYSGYIYVRSSGKLATGTYWITNVPETVSDLFHLGQKVVFSENGIADAPKHGIVDVDGTLYYYQYNTVLYNAGLIEYNGGWIYVRSSGKVATGAYWITNTNGKMDQGMYEFGADGMMIISDVEDGIVSEGGKLYYYKDGMKQYGLGLLKLEDSSYIYVRTNGELAVGSYWTTNHNGLLAEGMYDFGEDGILTVN